MASRGPNLLDALHHRGKHDVHNPDPPHQQGDAGNGSQYNIKNILGPLLLLQQQLRHGNFKILHLLMTPEQKPGQQIGGG